MSNRKSFRSFFKDIFNLIVLLGIAMLIRILIAELFFVPTGSMKFTILPGDYIVGTKYNYGYSRYSIPFTPDILPGKRIFGKQPSRGDIVIMRPTFMKDRLVKRLIGLPGDKIYILGDELYINDERIYRAFTGTVEDDYGNLYDQFQEILPSGVKYFSYKSRKEIYDQNKFQNFGPYIVPKGHYFFLGDNRDESSDSRYYIGAVPFENLIGKAQFIAFSTKENLIERDKNFIEIIKKIPQWISSVRYNRIFSSLYFEVEVNQAEVK